MDRNEFSRIRRYLRKSQRKMGLMLGISQKAVETYEMGTRNIPTSVERQALFLLASKSPRKRKVPVCWKVKHCSVETRQACPAWEFQLGHLCWFVNGTICEGVAQENWQKKIAICRSCEVFRSAVHIP